jgi:hypothetical protein
VYPDAHHRLGGRAAYATWGRILRSFKTCVKHIRQIAPWCTMRSYTTSILSIVPVYMVLSKFSIHTIIKKNDTKKYFEHSCEGVAFESRLYACCPRSGKGWSQRLVSVLGRLASPCDITSTT